MSFVSPEIEGLDGASLFIEESLDNEGRGIVLHQYIVTIKREGKVSKVQLSRAGLEQFMEALHGAWFEPLR